MTLKVSACYYYPLKSGAPIQTEFLELTERGPKNDRMWMLVDENGKFMSQRERGNDILALVKPLIKESGDLVLNAPDMPPLTISKAQYEREAVSAEVWGSSCSGHSAGTKASAWFKEYLGKECRLVAYNEDAPREIDPDFSNSGDIVSFADGMPLLVASTSSLQSLSQHFPSGVEISMNRFRPNIVVDGLEPFEEDIIHHLRIGDVELEFVKPCARCILTTIDQDTGEKNTGNEPVSTLAKQRRGAGQGLKGVFFGQNAIPRVLGEIKVGDEVQIVSTRSIHPALESVELGFKA